MGGLVMIVDDHPFIREMLRATFEGADLEVCEAVDGAEAIHLAPELKRSLIILDLSMPVMNGLEAAGKLKALMPEVPLLMFTNHLKQTVEKEAHVPRASLRWFPSSSPMRRHYCSGRRVLFWGWITQKCDVRLEPD